MGFMAADNPDEQNADFWDEPCGMAFAGQRGYDIDVPAGLDGFDQAYFEFYPYLRGYVDRALADATSVVEVGLGLGTTSRYMARNVESGSHDHQRPHQSRHLPHRSARQG